MPLLRLSTAFLCLAPLALMAQNKITISGYVTDSASGEALIGASVFDALTLSGTTTNLYGFYSLTLPQDTIEFTVAYVGYRRHAERLIPASDVTISVAMPVAGYLSEVEIVAERTERIEERSQMSTISLPVEQVKALPTLLGEKDVLKIVQLLPGVQSGTEGTSGLYVRGGGPDQNLILLDGVPVYNASHLFGFFSVFNPDAINSVQLIKGGFPARYGGRLSSVLDIRMKEGNMKEFHAEGSIGLVASKLTVEGPIRKGTTSFILSGRRTYIDLLMQPVVGSFGQAQGVKTRAGYYFYDLNAKINHKFSNRSRLYLSSYLGHDNAYSRIEENYIYDQTSISNTWNADLGWGNITTALRWNLEINSKTFMNVTGTHSRYRFNVGEDYASVQVGLSQTVEEGFAFQYLSGIYDWGVKLDVDFLPGPAHYVRFGLGEIYHTFTPGVNTFRMTESGAHVDTTFGASRVYAHEFSAYAEDDVRIGPRIKTNLGLHASGFLVNGKLYYSAQPRVSGRYLLAKDWSAKASFATMAQYIHLLTNATIGLPTDLWVPVTGTVKPMYSTQVAVGLAHTFRDAFEVSVEGYYKTMENLIEYKDGASFFNSGPDWQDKVETGRGWAYGTELFIQKTTGNTSGWIGYTLSWSERQFDNLNFGEAFPYRYDRRHDISLVITHRFNERTDVGLVWVYGTGNAVTLPITKYEAANAVYDYFNGSWYGQVEYFEKRNDFRMRSYHRLDLSLNKHRQRKWGETTWSLGFYNAYSRRNPFYVYVGYDWYSNNLQLKQVSLFPIIPFVSWSFAF
jgi:outer membrane cobalamin receptor